jgi:hypothetical protein
MRKTKAGPLPDQPTPLETARGRGGMDYDVLTQQIGKEHSDIMKFFDDHFLYDPKVSTEMREKYEKNRKSIIDRLIMDPGSQTGGKGPKDQYRSVEPEPDVPGRGFI